MTDKTRLGILLEIVWWLLTAVLAVAILFPIYKDTEGYPFYGTNLLFIITFVTFSRYIFQLKHTFLASRQIIKIVIVMLLIPFIFHLVSELNGFQTFLDEQGSIAVVGDLTLAKAEQMVNYVRSEMLFFGTGAIIASVLFFFRLILSVWRFRNRGTV